MAERKDPAAGVMAASDGSESFAYREIDTLENLSLQEVEALWDLVPTEDRDFITRRYRALVKRHQVGSDEQELKLADDYLQRYRYEGLVPAGENWVKISSARRLEMKRGETQAADVDEDDQGGTPWLTLAVVGFGLFLLIFLGARFLGGRGSAAGVATTATVTPTETPTPTFTPSPIPTITPTTTPTPIALVESDRFIAAGDGRDRAFFPVQFQISRPEDEQPRVFIVQERLVELTEWVFDPNPDVVSWISQTNIRPVLGIPYSEANEAFIRSLGPGTTFTLRMNTGAELHFTFAAASAVGRQDTALFQQMEPGVVLVLIGQTAADGLPTSTRYVVSGTYDPASSVDWTGFAGLPASVGETVAVPALSVTVDDARLVPVSDNASGALLYAVVDLTLTAQAEAVPLSTYRWFLDLGDTRYSPDLAVSADRLPYSSIPARLSAGQTVQSSVAFLVNSVGGDGLFSFAPPGGSTGQVWIPFNPLAVPASVDRLDVQLKRVQRDAQRVVVAVRVYNPQLEAVTLDTRHVGLVLGFTPNPQGPTQHPIDFEPILLEPEEARDLTLSFAWNADDPFATLSIAGYAWAIQLVE